MILVVDPGDTNGVALFNRKGELLFKFQCDFAGLADELQSRPEIETVIVEDYRLRKGKQAQQTGSRFQAVQAIGMLKFFCIQRGAEFVLADVQAKMMGSMYSGVKPPSDHKKSHAVDAYNIGIWWLVKEGTIEPPTLATL